MIRRIRAQRSTVTPCIGILLACIGLTSCGGSRPVQKRAAPAQIYVSNQLDNTVSVIDGATLKTLATVRVGVSPAQMAVSRDGKAVYVANTGSNTVSVLGTDNNKVASTIALPRGSKPIGVALSPNGRLLYTADGGDNRVSVVATQSRRVVATVRVGNQPLSIAAAPDGKTVYVANSGAGDLSVIDARTNRVVRTIPVGRFLSGVAVTPDGASVYVTDELSGVTVIHARNGTVAASLNEPSPIGVAISHNGDRAYVASLGPGTVVAIDTRTHRVSSTVSVGPDGTDPFTVQATADAVYVVNQGANTLSVIDPSTFKTTATIATGASPYGIAVVQRRRSIATASRPATRPCLPRCWCPARGHLGTPRAPDPCARARREPGLRP